MPQAAAASSSGTADAFINFGNGPFPEADTLTTGGGQAWFNSSSVQHVFGGTPNSQQQSSFENQVLQDVQKTFSLAGLNPSITIDPSVHANHTLSVVSNTSYTANANAIGITDVGANGFSFIDKLSYANSVQDLAWAVAHNVSHELMHAFGIGTHPDQTGTYLDAASATWSLLTNPNTTFSPAAAQLIQANNFGRNGGSGSLGAEVLVTHHVHGHPRLCGCPLCRGGYVLVGAEGLSGQPTPAPEPATVAFWTLAGLGLLSQRRRWMSRAAL